MTYGVSPVILAAAYSPFANGGVYHDPYFIEKITDLDGRIIYQHQDSGTRVLSAQSAYLMTDMLRTVTTSGTGAKLSGAGVQVAGKTGTVNMTGGGNRDVWMAAYTAEVSMATWMGFDNPDSSHRLAGWISGGDYPAALCRDFFKSWYSSREKPTFARPEGLVTAEIDKKSIEWRGQAMLASDLTPSAYRISEIFAAGTQPTQYSDVWSAPRSAKSFTVTHNEDGYPLLVIEAGDNAVYRVQRDAARGELCAHGTVWLHRRNPVLYRYPGATGRNLHVPGDPRARGAAAKRYFAGRRAERAGRPGGTAPDGGHAGTVLERPLWQQHQGGGNCPLHFHALKARERSACTQSVNYTPLRRNGCCKQRQQTSKLAKPSCTQERSTGSFPPEALGRLSASALAPLPGADGRVLGGGRGAHLSQNGEGRAVAGTFPALCLGK